MTNNFDKILPLLQWRTDDEFYYIQILQRKKEVNTLSSNSNVVKNYYAGSMEYLKKKEEEIIKLCDMFGARAMIRLNRRSWKQCALRGLEKIAGQCASEDFMSVRKFYERVCGRYTCEPKSSKKWILDIDEERTDSQLSDLEKAVIEKCDPEGRDKVLARIPSKNGLHLITRPFNIKQFRELCDYDIDIHKDNPTNLYIP